MGEFEDEAATVPVEPPTIEIALEDTAVAAVSSIKVRARTCPGWLPPAATATPMARRQKRFYDAITASKIL